MDEQTLYMQLEAEVKNTLLLTPTLTGLDVAYTGGWFEANNENQCNQYGGTVSQKNRFYGL